jgi:hypothetical protein
MKNDLLELIDCIKGYPNSGTNRSVYEKVEELLNLYKQKGGSGIYIKRYLIKLMYYYSDACYEYKENFVENIIECLNPKYPLKNIFSVYFEDLVKYNLYEGWWYHSRVTQEKNTFNDIVNSKIIEIRYISYMDDQGTVQEDSAFLLTCSNGYTYRIIFELDAIDIQKEYEIQCISSNMKFISIESNMQSKYLEDNYIINKVEEISLQQDPKVCVGISLSFKEEKNITFLVESKKINLYDNYFLKSNDHFITRDI